LAETCGIGFYEFRGRADVKVLYILSSPHGGSTLLSIVLGQQPLAANLGEVVFIPKLLALGERCTCGDPLAKCPQWNRAFAVLATRTGSDMRQNPYALYLGDAIKTKDGTGLIDHAHQTLRRRIVAKMRGAIEMSVLLGVPTTRLLKGAILPSVRRSTSNTMALYRAAADAWERSLLIDASKHPRKALHLHLLHPSEVCVLHLVRDGRAVTASRLRYMDAARAAERWHHYHRLTLALLSRWVGPDHRRMLRYEDFVEAPEKHLRSLCSWLGVDYSAAMLQFSANTSVHSAGGNPSRFQISGGIRPDVQLWRTTLNSDQLATFERIAGTLNRQLGYK